MVCYTGSNSEFGGTIDCGVRVRKAEVGQSCDLICENDPTKVKKLNCYAEAPHGSHFFGEWKGPNCHPDYTLTVAVFGVIAVICFLMVLLRRWRYKLTRAARRVALRQRHYQKHNTVHVVQCVAPPGTVATAPMGPLPMEPMWPAPPEFAAPMGPTAPEFATPMR
eukprot:66528_1